MIIKRFVCFLIVPACHEIICKKNKSYWESSSGLRSRQQQQQTNGERERMNCNEEIKK
jgi:hypothetical protein